LPHRGGKLHGFAVQAQKLRAQPVQQIAIFGMVRIEPRRQRAMIQLVVLALHTHPWKPSPGVPRNAPIYGDSAKEFLPLAHKRADCVRNTTVVPLLFSNLLTSRFLGVPQSAPCRDVRTRSPSPPTPPLDRAIGSSFPSAALEGSSP